jgi:hypothetical protein
MAPFLAASAWAAGVPSSRVMIAAAAQHQIRRRYLRRRLAGDRDA